MDIAGFFFALCDSQLGLYPQNMFWQGSDICTWMHVCVEVSHWNVYTLYRHYDL